MRQATCAKFFTKRKFLQLWNYNKKFQTKFASRKEIRVIISRHIRLQQESAQDLILIKLSPVPCPKSACSLQFEKKIQTCFVFAVTQMTSTAQTALSTPKYIHQKAVIYYTHNFKTINLKTSFIIFSDIK